MGRTLRDQASARAQQHPEATKPRIDWADPEIHAEDVVINPHGHSCFIFFVGVLSV